MGGISGTRLRTSLAVFFLVTMMLWLAAYPTSVAVQAAPLYYSYVYGKAVDEGGVGLSNVNVQIYTSGGVLVANTSTGSDGSFGVGIFIQYGTYSIYLAKPAYAEALKSIAIQSSDTNLGTVVLSKALKLTSSTLSLVANPADKVAISFMVGNIGEDAETVEFLISKPEDWTARILYQSLGVTKIYVQPGQSLTLQLELAIPLTATVNVNYNVSLTSIGTTNSSLSFSIRVEPSDSTILSCQFPGKTVVPGDTTRFQVRVSNPVNVEQRFSISVNAVPSGWVTSVKTASGEAVAEVMLGRSEFLDLVVEVSTPPSTSEGKYSLIFTAESPSMSENLPLLMNVQRAAAGVEITATPPYLDVYAGSQARFKLKASNIGGYDELLNLTAEGLLQGWRAWFEDANKQEITKAYVEAGQPKEFYLVVSTPKGARLGAQSLTVTIASADVNRTVNLSLNVLGLYEIRTTNQNFYTSLNVGGEGAFVLTVRNSGTQDVANVKAEVTGTTPQGFTVSVEPVSLSSLKVDGEASFTITVKTQSDVNAGNYYVDFNVWSDQTQPQSFTLRIEVIQETSWLIYAGILIVIAVVGLFLVYRRFGRR